MGIGKNVKKYRAALGMDQKTLAARLGVTAGAVSNYENDISSPKEEILYKMFEVFGVTPNELFAGCYAETKKSPAPEGTEDKISVDDMKAMLRGFGFLDANGDLSDDDLKFLSSVFDLLDAWFSR